MTDFHATTGGSPAYSPHATAVSPEDDARTILLNRIAWGAVLAGVVVALATQLIVNMIGVGIGAATLNPGTGDNPSATTFSMSAAAWWALSGILGSLVGGYTAGRLSGRPHAGTAGWHGFTSWALATLVIFYLLTTAVGGLLGGAYQTVTSALGGVGQAAGGAVQTAARTAAPSLAGSADPFASISQTIRDNTGGQDPAALRDAAVNAMKNLVSADESQLPAAREQAAQALAKARGIPVEEARTQVGQLEGQYRQTVDTAKQKATQAADATAKAVSRGALLGSLSLLLGGLAAWFGGRAGTVRPTVTQSVSRTTVDVRDERSADGTSAKAFSPRRER